MRDRGFIQIYSSILPLSHSHSSPWCFLSSSISIPEGVQHVLLMWQPHIRRSRRTKQHTTQPILSRACVSARGRRVWQSLSLACGSGGSRKPIILNWNIVITRVITVMWLERTRWCCLRLHISPEINLTALLKGGAKLVLHLLRLKI